jgi:HK97 family phage major capsid protein
MSHIMSLREQRSTLITDARTELDKITDEMNEGEVAEYESRFDAAMAEADKIEARISREQRLLDAEAALEQRVEQRAERTKTTRGEAEKATDIENRAFANWLKGGMNALTSEQRDHMMARQTELRAQSVGTDSAGGYTVPEGFRAQLEETIDSYGGVRQVAQILRTASGNPLPMPTVDDTSNKGVILAENSQVSEQDVEFGQVTLGAYMFSSKLVRVSLQLLQDSAFDLPAYLSRALGERIARATNEYFTTGTGSSQPKGVVNVATSGKVGASGQTTSVTYDDLVDLIHSVDPAYRVGGAFLFSDTALRNLRKLKDSTGLPIWQPSTLVGEPDRILGHRYVVSNDMAAPAASGKSILFGDFSKFIIRDVLDLQVVRFQERYLDYLQIGFMAYSRHDSNGINPSAIKFYQQAAS